jgi:hypothetical protein
MAKKVMMIHQQTGLIKKGYYGFSWTYLFWGFLVPIIRGELIIALLHFVLTLITLGIWHFIMAFLYNKQYMTRLLEKGYTLDDSELVNAAARSKLGIAKVRVQQ